MMKKKIVIDKDAATYLQNWLKPKKLCSSFRHINENYTVVDLSCNEIKSIIKSLTYAHIPGGIQEEIKNGLMCVLH